MMLSTVYRKQKLHST